MPRVKIDYVVSFSSEDPEHPASNLLNREVSKKKWLCKKGEASCSVVLQLARAVKISAVHIGAYNAALVEVLVARLETSSEQFQMLVPSSVFVSREESRRDSGSEIVRSFSADQLSQPARDQRWDRLRLVCSQPYNRHCKYGLSFVHIDEAEGGAASVPARLLALETFSSDEDEFKPGELFAKHLQKTSAADSPAKTLSNTGAQIRQATLQALKNIPESSTTLIKTPINKLNVKRDAPAFAHSADRSIDRSRETLLYTQEEERPNAKIDRVLQRHIDEKQQEDRSKNDRHDGKEKDTSIVNSPKLKDNSSQLIHNKNKAKRNNSISPPRNQMTESKPNKNNDKLSDQQKDKNLSKRRRSDSQEKPGPVSEEPHTLLRGAVLVLSGYENPRRALLRRTALALGARLERDWAPHCTHLICAFPNTPKLRAARAAGGAGPGPVPAPRGEWLEECAARRRVLPWRWFAAEPHLRREPRTDSPPPDTSRYSDSEDTDDEIEKVLRQQKKRRLAETNLIKQKPNDTSTAAPSDEKHKKNVEVHDSAEEELTEEESEAEAEAAVQRLGGALPDLFQGRTFLIDAAPAHAALMARYVHAYGGLVLQISAVEGGTEVDYVVRGRRGASGSVPPASVPPANVPPTNVSHAWLCACVTAQELLPLPPAS